MNEQQRASTAAYVVPIKLVEITGRRQEELHQLIKKSEIAEKSRN